MGIRFGMDDTPTCLMNRRNQGCGDRSSDEWQSSFVLMSDYAAPTVPPRRVRHSPISLIVRLINRVANAINLLRIPIVSYTWDTNQRYPIGGVVFSLFLSLFLSLSLPLFARSLSFLSLCLPTCRVALLRKYISAITTFRRIIGRIPRIIWSFAYFLIKRISSVHD